MNENTTNLPEKRKIEILLFCVLFFSAAYFNQYVDYDNTFSRYFMISAIVDHKTLNIDKYKDNTIDKSFYEGHYYSNKAIGAPLLGVPVYWLMRCLKPGENPRPLTRTDRFLIRLITTSIPFALLGVVLFRTACFFGAGLMQGIWMVIAYSFGSIALSHAGQFSGHQMAASFSFFSFAILFMLNKKKNNNKFYMHCMAFLAGLFAGLGALADYTAMFLALVLTIYLICLRLHRNIIIFFLTGGAICVLCLGVYNYTCFDSVFSFSYSHLTHAEFKEGASSGLLGVSLPDPLALMLLLFSPARGLFFIMPVFIFSIIGFTKLWKKDDLKREAVLLSVIVIGYLCINAGFYGWHGGWTFGPRYLVPMLPFLALPMIFVPFRNPWFFLLLGISVFQVLLAVVGIPHTPEKIFNPIFEIILPLMAYGYTAKNFGHLLGLKGFLSVTPFFVIIIYALTIVLRTKSAEEDKKDVPRSWKILMGTWALMIMIMLAVVHTTPSKVVHYYRGRILMTAAKQIRSIHLLKMSLLENKLAKTDNVEE